MQQKYSDLIRKRISNRTYEHRALADSDKQKLTRFMDNLSDNPFGIKTRFTLIEAGSMGGNTIKLVTYGFIKGAYTFIAAATKHQDLSLETLGYQMEKIILFATSLKLGTCWLGGTFNRGSFANAIDLQEDEFLPIATPIGYPINKLTFREKMVRRGAGSDNRKAWSEIFYLDDFNTMLNKETVGKYQNAFEMVRLAPSASNKQPWLLVLDGKNNIIHLYLNRMKKYVGNKLGFEIQKIDIGIAMCHLECALSDDNIHGEFVIDDPKLELPVSDDNEVIYEVSFRVK